MIIFYFRSTT